MSNEEIIAIPPDTNLASFSNVDEIGDGSKASISEPIAMLSCRIVGVVLVQSCAPA